MATPVERTARDNDPPMLEITDKGQGRVAVRVYAKPGTNGGKGAFRGGVELSIEAFLDIVVALWPNNVAYQFDTDSKRHA